MVFEGVNFAFENIVQFKGDFLSFLRLLQGFAAGIAKIQAGIDNKIPKTLLMNAALGADASNEAIIVTLTPRIANLGDDSDTGRKVLSKQPSTLR